VLHAAQDSEREAASYWSAHDESSIGNQGVRRLLTQMRAAPLDATTALPASGLGLTPLSTDQTLPSNNAFSQWVISLETVCLCGALMPNTAFVLMQHTLLMPIASRLGGFSAPCVRRPVHQNSLDATDFIDASAVHLQGLQHAPTRACATSTLCWLTSHWFGWL
jgi:hypothetical protein